MIRQKFENKIKKFFLSRENPESDLLALILEDDPIFLEKFLQLWIIPDFEINKIKIKREGNVKEGRLDLIFKVSNDVKLIVEVKRIAGELHDDSETNLLRYLEIGSPVGILMSKHSISEEISEHKNFTNIVLWKLVASVLKQRLEDENIKLLPKDEIIYWSHQLINYIEDLEGKIMKLNEPITYFDAIAYSAKNDLQEKFKNILDNSLQDIKNYRYKLFQNLTKNNYQDDYQRYGLILRRNDREDKLSLFYGLRFNLKTNGILSVISFIESNPKYDSEARKQIPELIEDFNIESDNMSKVLLSKDQLKWQIVEISIPLSIFLSNSSYDKQIDEIRKWFNRSHRIFTDILKQLSVDL